VEIASERAFGWVQIPAPTSFGPYILDYYCPAARLVIELDGDTHATLEGKQSDAEREKYLTIRGIQTIRFWNTEMEC
jgi:very-short-patch-repair endonuclease